MHSKIFERLIEEEKNKGVWDTLKKFYEDDKKLKKVKLQSLKKQCKHSHMNDCKYIVEFFSWLMMLTNQMKSCGENISEVQKVKKDLRYLTTNFNHIVMTIEDSKDHFEIKLKEFQTSFKTHELRFKQRNSKKVSEQTL